MPANSSVLYSQQYSSAVELLAQQLRPRIATLFTPGERDRHSRPPSST
jgi:hypothetical protein